MNKNGNKDDASHSTHPNQDNDLADFVRLMKSICKMLDIGPAKESAIADMMSKPRAFTREALDAMEAKGLAKRIDSLDDPLWASAALRGGEKPTMKPSKEARPSPEKASPASPTETTLAGFRELASAQIAKRFVKNTVKPNPIQDISPELAEKHAAWLARRSLSRSAFDQKLDERRQKASRKKPGM